MNKKYLIIKADTNDADYVTSKNLIDDETLAKIMPVINAIKSYDEDETIKEQKYNWWMVEHWPDRHPSPFELYLDSGKCTESQFDTFAEMVPSFEGGVHSIESIELIEVVKEERL